MVFKRHGIPGRDDGDVNSKAFGFSSLEFVASAKFKVLRLLSFRRQGLTPASPGVRSPRVLLDPSRARKEDMGVISAAALLDGR